MAIEEGFSYVIPCVPCAVRVPQRLKPANLWLMAGTAEAVLLPNSDSF